jgi:AraC family transcriptional regulator, arabinose operon regulatory protein
MSCKQERYHENLELSGMATSIHLNPVYFGKLFKKNTGYSFKEYLNLIRINNAEMLLATGEFNVTEVAERCGFNDVSYFSNVFKSIKGFPPSNVSK